MSALARTTLSNGAEPDTFVFLGGDVCHHAGELRPTQALPLPMNISTPHHSFEAGVCPGAYYAAVHSRKSTTTPFYEPAEGGFNLDKACMLSTLENVQSFDADPNIFLIIAHDNSLLPVIDLFPFEVNGWKEEDWKARSRWRFLEDFDIASGGN